MIVLETIELLSARGWRMTATMLGLASGLIRVLRPERLSKIVSHSGRNHWVVKKVHSVHTIRTRQKGSEVSPAFSAPGTKTYLGIGSHSCVICLLHVSILRTTGQPLGN